MLSVDCRLLLVGLRAAGERASGAVRQELQVLDVERDEVAPGAGVCDGQQRPLARGRQAVAGAVKELLDLRSPESPRLTLERRVRRLTQRDQWVVSV